MARLRLEEAMRGEPQAAHCPGQDGEDAGLVTGQQACQGHYGDSPGSAAADVELGGLNPGPPHPPAGGAKTLLSE